METEETGLTTVMAEECQACGERKTLDAQGLCDDCEHAVPCPNHEDVLTARQCRDCDENYCAFCLQDGSCEGCRAKRGPSPKARMAQLLSPMAVRLRDQPFGLKLAVGLVILGALATGLWTMVGGGGGSPDAIATAVEARLTTVQTAIAGRPHRQRPVASLTEIAELIKEAGEPVPTLVPKQARPIPDAVVVDFAGDKVELSATTPEGTPYEKDGKPYVLSLK